VTVTLPAPAAPTGNGGKLRLGVSESDTVSVARSTMGGCMRLPGSLNWTVGGPAVRALGGSLLTVTGSRYAQWRERWAREEYERRVRAYRASLADWRRQDAELRWLVTAAAATRPARHGNWSGWLPLARDEVVYWAAGDAGIVEAPYALRLRPPHFREFSRTEEPAAGSPVDTGQVAVTDQRVVFVGRTRREWTYSTLIGMAHTEAGQTWLLVTSRTQVSGVAAPPPMAAEFRLHLALALADRASQRDAFVAELAARLQRHQQAKPRPPAPVAVDGAPRPARWGRRRRLVTAAAASAAVLSLFTVGIAPAGNDRHPESLSGSAESPVVPSPVPAATPESPTPGAEATAASRGEPLRQAVPQQRQPLPPPPPPPATTPFPCPSPSPAPSPSPSADTLDPWFRSCDEANSNGYGPYFRGQDLEYYWYWDRNGDGVVCKP
jgi:hypothetical protein